MKRILALAVVGAFSLTAFGQEPQDGQRTARKNRLIVHEWGTFTAVYGADGTMMEWRPHIGSDLPKFVYRRSSVAPTAAQRATQRKLNISSYQRMETPVLYFYSDNEMVVDVSVGFPKGLITEWYPRVRDFRPLLGNGRMPISVSNGWVRWGKIRLFPQDQIHPVLPTNGHSDHYYHARKTDAAYVRVCPVGDEYKKSEYEKFLFYRGVGNFGLPLKIRAKKGGRFSIENPTRKAIKHVFVIDVQKDGRGRFQFLDQVVAGQTRQAALGSRENWLSKEKLIRRISEELEECLVMEGLYRKEAKAMIQTWTDSYFETPGTRVLYLLPESTTNELLPLSIKPKPVELKRVLVARVDIFTPEQTAKLQALLRDLGSRSLDKRDRAEKAIAAYGRFAVPALRESIRLSTDREIRDRAEALIRKLTTIRR